MLLTARWMLQVLPARATLLCLLGAASSMARPLLAAAFCTSAGTACAQCLCSVGDNSALPKANPWGALEALSQEVGVVGSRNCV